MRSAKRFVKTAMHYPLALGFILLIGVGLFLIVTRIQANKVIAENRKIANFPGCPANYTAWRAYPRQFEDALNDRFPFRNALVQLYKTAAYKFFRHSTHPEVVVGQHDWLFYSGVDSMADYRGEAPLTSLQVSRIAASVQQMNEEARRQGSRFLLVIAPDKQTVYPEWLPASIKEGHPHRVDQLLDALKGTEVPFLDLRPFFLQAKAMGEILYYRYDTHWNDVGAYFGFAAILKSLELPAPLRAEVSFKNRSQARHSDMAVTMLGINGLREADPQFVSFQSEGRIFEPVLESPKSRTPPFDVVYETTHGNQKSVLFVHDSFGVALKPFFASVFARSRCVWPYYLEKPFAVTPEWIAEEKPDYVIFLMVQRDLIAIP